MSQSTGDHPRRSLPFLPPELTLRIIEESEEASEHTTVIYPRSDRKEDGTFTRGKFEVLPMQHRCVAGVIQASDTPALPFDPREDQTSYDTRQNLHLEGSMGHPQKARKWSCNRNRRKQMEQMALRLST
ncbi:hypothetical protein FOPG_13149 [Fusarium oxysporum f. sp. conglutinans race 2 54008]|uniref:Uncharacterized protein n=1 Tax=Fusarium oxysporum f. sp. conglutinans race 2 54008 TaxID=1089457 RepID=X0HHC0_FUSOX|nr:hypothetical protein FOPG_13149 [Fusarium oxysporum f. sp. conglutinans race 2 54008]KAI8400411.1 hypothetical protein FOFC_19250 [Fusarium oxysporum]WKT51282.1 hypothetical protein QSH57_016252 [Fusarium oxysporum f. sp. vasinfectum]